MAQENKTWIHISSLIHIVLVFTRIQEKGLILHHKWVVMLKKGLQKAYNFFTTYLVQNNKFRKCLITLSTLGYYLPFCSGTKTDKHAFFSLYGQVPAANLMLGTFSGVGRLPYMVVTVLLSPPCSSPFIIGISGGSLRPSQEERLVGREELWRFLMH